MKILFEEMTSEQKAREKKEFAIRIGSRLKEVRKSKGLSQEELAHKAGYYRTYVGHVETAKYSPSVHTMWRFSKAMDIKLADLLEKLD
jgi:transcriptional regulator with XRE-family HTH domain